MFKDKSVKEISELAKIWYDLGGSILPEFGTKRFAAFCAESYTLVNEASGKAFEHVSIDTDMGGEIGYIDATDGTIHISSKLFNENIYKDFLGEDAEDFLAELAVTLFNGTVIHEGLHSQITFSSRSFFVDGISGILKMDFRYDDLIEKYGIKLSARAFNIIEDLFIESHVPDKLANWIQAYQDIVFRNSDILDMPEPDNPMEVLNFAVLYKNKNLRNHPRILSVLNEDAIRILNRASSGESMSSLAKRASWTFDLLEALFSDYENKDSDEGEESESGDKESKDKKDTNRAINPLDGSEKFKEVLEKSDDLDDEEIDEINREIEKQIKDIKKRKKEEREKEDSESFSDISDLVEVDVLNATRFKKTIEPEINIDATFVKQLKAIRTDNRAPGQASKRGSVMVKSRLTRIVTDQKIFARRDSERSDGSGNQKQSRMEVIINIDLSGSTRGRIANNEMGAAYEMSKALKSAQIPHSVYGHSGGFTPTVYHIYSFRMQQNNSDFEKRFNEACSLPLSQNYDGLVIEHLMDKFTNRRANCFLINMSDGVPLGWKYVGSSAMRHTKNAVKKARERGISVFSLSVVKSVVDANDDIYGEDYNIDCSKNLSEQFKKLLKKLATGKR